MYRILICILLFLRAFQLTAYAESNYTLDIDTSDINAYLSETTEYAPDYETIVEYVKSGNIKALLRYVANHTIYSLKDTLVDHNYIMYTIIAICLLSALIRVASDDNSGAIYELLAVSALSVILIGAYSSVFSFVTDVVKNLFGFMNVSLPVYFGVSASVTSRLPFSVYGAFVTFVALFHWGANAVLLPSVSAMALCSVAESVYPAFGAGSIRKFISNSMHWALGLYTTIFIAVMKITQIASYGTDKLVMSGVRYTLARGVPVVGGFIAEAAGAVITSTLILHNTLGICSVLVIVFIGFLPFVTVFILSGIIRLIAAALSPLASSGVVSLLRCFGECLCELAVVLLCACVTFVIGLGIEMSAVR